MKLRSRTVTKKRKSRKTGGVKKHRTSRCSEYLKTISTRSMKSKQNAPATTIEHLPAELLLDIFSRLGHRDKLNVSRVCRYWKTLGSDFTLWKSISAFGDNLTTGELVGVIRSQPRLLRVTLSMRDDCNVLLGAVGRYAHNLQALSILGCRGSAGRKNIGAKPLVKLLKSCRKLTELVIEGSTFRSCVFYRYLLADLQGKLKRLRLIVNPTAREWACLYKAQALQQLVIGVPGSADP